jgi:hypothetical protein
MERCAASIMRRSSVTDSASMQTLSMLCASSITRSDLEGIRFE